MVRENRFFDISTLANMPCCICEHRDLNNPVATLAGTSVYEASLNHTGDTSSIRCSDDNPLTRIIHEAGSISLDL